MPPVPGLTRAMPRTNACSKPSDEGHDSASAPRRFLAEVQALRAIAVIAVVIYHLDPAWLPGGFTGVDAFFVVSGFLITGHLLAQLRDTGTIRLRRFWAGRLRRLLPAQLVVIAASALAALVVLPWGELTTTLRQGLASLFYVQNWFLAAGSTDYLNASTPPTAFQHFWSLAIEEQFYLAWPVLLVAGWLAAKRMRSSVAGPLIAVTSITVASLALCLVPRVGRSGPPRIRIRGHRHGCALPRAIRARSCARRGRHHSRGREGRLWPQDGIPAEPRRVVHRQPLLRDLPHALAHHRDPHRVARVPTLGRPRWRTCLDRGHVPRSIPLGREARPLSPPGPLDARCIRVRRSGTGRPRLGVGWASRAVVAQLECVFPATVRGGI